MSIDSKIREAFKKKENSPNKWDSSTQPNLYELNNFLTKAGYRLLDVIEVEKNIELIVEPTNPGPNFPEIVHDVKDNKFYIKVVDQGLLEASDLDSIVVGYENAISIVRHLESLDLSVLELVKEK